MAKINYNYEKRAREIEKEKKKEEKLKKKEVLNNSKKAEEVPSSIDEKSKEQFLLNEGQASYYKLYIDDKYNSIKYAVPKIQSYISLFHPYFKGL